MFSKILLSVLILLLSATVFAAPAQAMSSNNQLNPNNPNSLVWQAAWDEPNQNSSKPGSDLTLWQTALIGIAISIGLFAIVKLIGWHDDRKRERKRLEAEQSRSVRDGLINRRM